MHRWQVSSTWLFDCGRLPGEFLMRRASRFNNFNSSYYKIRYRCTNNSRKSRRFSSPSRTKKYSSKKAFVSELFLAENLWLYKEILDLGSILEGHPQSLLEQCSKWSLPSTFEDKRSEIVVCSAEHTRAQIAYVCPEFRAITRLRVGRFLFN